MTNLNVRQAMFPYGMEKNPDGSWTFFNRKYKTLGTITDGWSEWNDPLHKMFITGLGPSTLAKLDCHGLEPVIESISTTMVPILKSPQQTWMHI